MNKKVRPNKIVIKPTSEGRWGAVIKGSNGRKAWEIPIKGLKSRRSVKNAIALLSKPFIVVEETITSNITG